MDRQMNGKADKSEILLSFDPHVDTHQCCSLKKKKKKTALIPVVPHILARGRTAHPNLSTRVCYERVTHFGWDHSLVHVCVSIPLTCMGTKHQGDRAAGMEGYTVKQHINNKE